VGGLVQRIQVLDDRVVPSALVNLRSAPTPSPSTVQLTTPEKY
jgi:hypothetical protein